MSSHKFLFQSNSFSLRSFSFARLRPSVSYKNSPLIFVVLISEEQLFLFSSLSSSSPPSPPLQLQKFEMFHYNSHALSDWGSRVTKLDIHWIHCLRRRYDETTRIVGERTEIKKFSMLQLSWSLKLGDGSRPAFSHNQLRLRPLNYCWMTLDFFANVSQFHSTSLSSSFRFHQLCLQLQASSL